MKKLMGSAFLALALLGTAMAQDRGDGGGHGHVPPHADHPSHGHTAHFMDHLRKRLDLSDEQAVKVKEVLDELQKETERLASGSPGKLDACRSRAWADIRVTLNEEQRSEFDKLIEEHHGHTEGREHGQCGYADGQERERPHVGEELKDIVLADSTGSAFQLAAFRRTKESAGTITVLTFWCTTCGSCRMVEKDLDEKARDYKDKGVQFLMVASNHAETPDGVNRFLKKNRLGFRVLMDPESALARYLGAATTTTTAVVDAEGRLRYYGSLTKAEDAIRNLIAGEEVAVPETRPMGCMIMMKPESQEVTKDKSRGQGEAHGGQ